MRCRWAIPLLAGVIGFAPAESVHADTYKCVTPDGKKHAGTEPPPECKDLPMVRVRPNGAEEEILPPSAQRRKAQEEEARRQRDERERRQRQMLDDYRLLDAYKSEADIETARQRDLAALQSSIAGAPKLLEGMKRERVQLGEEAKFYEKRELPESLKKAIESNEARSLAVEKRIADVRAAMQRVNAEYDAKLKRFRELTRDQTPLEQFEKLEGVQKSDKAARAEKGEKADRGDKADKAESADKSAKK